MVGRSTEIASGLREDCRTERRWGREEGVGFQVKRARVSHLRKTECGVWGSFWIFHGLGPKPWFSGIQTAINYDFHYFHGFGEKP